MALAAEVVQKIEGRVGDIVRRKYRLDAVLGMGSTAAVYAATHRNGSRFALKMLHPELASNDAIQARFLREGYVANLVPHPGVVRILDDDDDDACATVFLVMELLDGTSLEVALAGSMPHGAVLRIGERLLHVLAAAHDVGVVHRDVKPANVFVTRDGDVRLLDFGVARLLDGSGATRSGQVLGTPAFMAPEQAAGRVRDVDARTDVWSSGALLFTLLTGRVIHAGARSRAEALLFAATQPAPRLRSVAPSVDVAIADVVDRAVSFDRDARFRDAGEMRNALLVAMSANGPTSSPA